MTRRTRSALFLGLLGVLLLTAGELLAQLGRDTICSPDLWSGRTNVRRCVLYVFPTALHGSAQLGVLAVALGLVWGVVGRLPPQRRAAVETWSRSWALRILALVTIAFVTGEVAIRALYWDGISFGTHTGPLVRRFERDFVMNGYDGPSRGPEVEGPKPPGVQRILIQGDSITWGQGVRHESQLYSQLLLERMREHNPGIEVAVLAKGGREIDGHLDQLLRLGPRIEPDAIIYQWFVNDIELDKEGRPQAQLPWRGLFFHPLLSASSALWFFLDYALAQLWPVEHSYVDYIATDYAPGTEGWRRFEEMFARWAEEARRLTPRTLVALCPRVNPPSEMLFTGLHERVRRLAAAHGLETLELIDAFEGLEGDYQKLWASPYDAHPGALAHDLIAASLEQRVLSLWPELGH